jgi:hypothetical protein
MKVLASWNVRPGAVKEAVGRFLATQGKPAPGVTLLGRWHKADCSGGFSLFETNNPAALYEGAAGWTDVLEVHTHVVIEDAEAGPVLAKLRKVD